MPSPSNITKTVTGRITAQIAALLIEGKHIQSIHINKDLVIHNQ